VLPVRRVVRMPGLGEFQIPSFSKIGLIDVLARLFRLGKILYPERRASDFKHRAALLGLGISRFRDIQAWYGIADNPHLALALSRFPDMHGAIYWPYIHHAWPRERRLRTIDSHYRLLEGRACLLAASILGEVELLSLDAEYPGLRVTLDKAIWFLREGEVVLNLFLRDQRIYSIAFSLGNEDGALVAYVGALQGSNVEGALATYREITRALHAMRPRDFIVMTLQFLCKELGVAKIYAISGAARQHNSPYFGDSHKHKVLANYDEVWIEHGGRLLDSGFFEIPTAVRYREMSEIPTRKRSTYRKRYQMLDRVTLDLAGACIRHESKGAESGRDLG
jgi:uncharacterized protein